MPLISAETSCSGDDQRMTLRQDRFVIAPARYRIGPAVRGRWQVPVAVGSLGSTRPPEVLLLDGSAEIAAGTCGEAIKVNLGDIGYYRVEYGPDRAGARWSKSLALMAPEDRAQFSRRQLGAGAGRPRRAAVLSRADRGDRRRRPPRRMGSGDRQPDRGSIVSRSTAPSARRCRIYARAKLRPVFDRLGWDGGGSGDDDDTLLRSSADLRARRIRRRRYHRRGQTAVRGLPCRIRHRCRARCATPSPMLVGHRRRSRQAMTRCWRWRARATATNERLRYYYAAASARDPALARATLALTLTDELPNTIIGGMINTVASSGEQPRPCLGLREDEFRCAGGKARALVPATSSSPTS